MGKLIDLTGTVVGKLTVINRAVNGKYGHAHWNCRCECGNFSIVRGYHLVDGSTKSCGCSQFSPEAIAKRAVANTGEKNHMWNKKHTVKALAKMSVAHKGSEVSTETRSKISATMKAKNYNGEMHHNWKHSKTNEERRIERSYPEYNKFRKKVFERDVFTCQYCGDNRGGNLNAHHIENYAANKDLRLSIDNAITLCKKCHKSLHHQFGRTTTKEHLNMFMVNYNG